MNYSAPPLKIIVAVLVFLHSLNKLYLSAPIYFSSNSPQNPNTSTVNPCTVVWIYPPVAFTNLFISSDGTLPAQKIFLSAKY